MRKRHSLLSALVFALVAIIAASCSSRPGAIGVSRTHAAIRVLSYNIHAGKDATQHPNLERVARVIDSLRADVVLLQEVDRGTERSGDVDQVAELERLTGMHGAFAKSLDYQGGDYGIAALSRWPIDSAETVPLPTNPPADRGSDMYEPRVAIHLLLSAPAGKLEVIGTHLGAERESTFRDQEARDLLQYIVAHTAPDSPLIIGGDFNSIPESDIHTTFAQHFHDSWERCGTGEGFTFPADTTVRRIDYLYSRGLRCTTAEVVDTQASDHRPLLVDFELSSVPDAQH